MILEDLLPLLNENRNVSVLENDDEIARYNGKDSIPFDINDREVIEINIEDNGFKISVAPEEKPVNITTDDKSGMTVYIGGSFNAETKTFGWSMILLTTNNSPKGYEIFTGCSDDASAASMRNVAGEICAAITAAKKAFMRGFDKIIIYYDYEGIASWATGAWKTNKYHTEAYKDYIRKINTTGTMTEFHKVKAHVKDFYNELADKYAKAACGVISDSILKNDAYVHHKAYRSFNSLLEEMKGGM